MAAGTATITATSEDGGFTATCDVTVTDPVPVPVAVTGVTVAPTTLALEPGSSANVTATVAPADASNKNVTWSSDNAAVATVDTSGKVTAVADGTATITTTTEDGGFTASCTVTVSTSSGGGGSHKGGSSVSGSQSNAPVYSVEAASGIENGSVEFSTTSSVSGKEITVTPKPIGGYEIESVTVTDKNDKTVAVTDNKDGTYKFTMPDSNVKVSATFKQIAQPVDSHDCPAKNFTDVDTSLWYHEGVDYAIANGLMNGISSDKFDPTGATTRAMLVTILYRVEGTPAVTTSAGFNDVADGTWYTDAVNWAAEKGIVTGYSSDTFGPTDNVTREQLATILYRYVQFKGVDVSVGEDASITSFADFNTVGDWAFNAVLWANNAGIINGTDARKLAPKATASRAEIATMLMRAADLIK